MMPSLLVHPKKQYLMPKATRSGDSYGKVNNEIRQRQQLRVYDLIDGSD